MSGIILDKKLGVNPKLTYCPMCGGETQELILIGARKYKTKCSHCGTVNFGSSTFDKCGKCKIVMTNGEKEPIGEYDRLPATEPCDKCKEVLEIGKIGLVFKCEAGCFGAIRETEFTDSVREEQGVPKGYLLGVEFSASNCPNAENHGGQ